MLQVVLWLFNTVLYITHHIFSSYNIAASIHLLIDIFHSLVLKQNQHGNKFKPSDIFFTRVSLKVRCHSLFHQCHPQKNMSNFIINDLCLLVPVYFVIWLCKLLNLTVQNIFPYSWDQSKRNMCANCEIINGTNMGVRIINQSIAQIRLCEQSINQSNQSKCTHLQLQ